jgi:hypothetical protein
MLKKETPSLFSAITILPILLFLYQTISEHGKHMNEIKFTKKRLQVDTEQ